MTPFNCITHNIEVTLQFGLCNALASDFASRTPSWQLSRLFQRSISSLFRTWIIFDKRHLPDGSHFAIWTLQCTRKWRCAFRTKLKSREAVHVSISSLLHVNDIHTHSRDVTLHVGLFSAVASGSTSSSSSRSPVRLFSFKVSLKCSCERGISGLT